MVIFHLHRISHLYFHKQDPNFDQIWVTDEPPLEVQSSCRDMRWTYRAQILLEGADAPTNENFKLQLPIQLRQDWQKEISELSYFEPHLVF